MKRPSILDPAFKYVPASVHLNSADHLRDKFRKIIAQQKREAEAAKAEQQNKVTTIKGRMRNEL